MLHEKPNEPFHWKDKLDELDHLPGESLADRAASWEKLHHRLHEKPVSRKLIWYWLAAACVLIVAGIIRIMPGQTHEQIVGEQHRPSPEQPKNKSDVIGEKAAIVSIKKPVPGSTKKPMALGTIKKDHRVSKSTVITADELPDSATTEESFPAITVQSRQAADSINTKVIINTAIAKKLRVIHINEIVKPVEEMPFAKVTLRVPQRKPSDQDEFSTLSLGKNASDNLIKIKLSPSN